LTLDLGVDDGDLLKEFELLKQMDGQGRFYSRLFQQGREIRMEFRICSIEIRFLRGQF
jgi:hypothetical protein